MTASPLRRVQLTINEPPTDVLERLHRQVNRRNPLVEKAPSLLENGNTDNPRFLEPAGGQEHSVAWEVGMAYMFPNQ